MRLQDRVAIMTGSASRSGIGRAIDLMFIYRKFYMSKGSTLIEKTPFPVLIITFMAICGNKR